VEAVAQSGTGSDAAIQLSALVVCADQLDARRRIATALDGAGLPCPLQLGTAGDDLAELELDAAAVIVLACDIEVVREMAILRRLRRELPDPSIVVVSAPAQGTGVRRALDAGADAIVFEPVIDSALAITVLAVVSGQLAVPRDFRASVERPAFSHRERQVLSLVARGLTNSEIGKSLFLSESTIKSHLSSAFAKLGVRSRKEAAAVFRDRQQTISLGLADLDATPIAAPAQT
jgi:DNA-binding NarL/FixJ family response regulator